MFRQVDLPRGVRGALYLHHMPGAVETYAQFQEAARKLGIQRVICLTLRDEVRLGSPDYHRALEEQSTGWQPVNFPIQDYGVPEERNAFIELAREVAKALIRGEKVLVHCYGGKGRSGMLAEVVLMALGLPPEEAEERVQKAGSHPERMAQRDLVRWAARQLSSTNYR